jgi:hypothetical protein
MVVTSWTEQQAYDRRCVTDMMARRVQGKTYRDFESAVFTVDKKDGGHRLAMHGLSSSKPIAGEGPFQDGHGSDRSGTHPT